MSACISRHGEFSEHTLDNSHTCTRCHVLDEEALRAELEKLRAELARYVERLDLDAWERLEAERDQLRERLAAAETVCTIYGWTGGGEDSERGKATTQAWMDWHHAYGSPEGSPEWDARIAELAARRDAIRAKTLAAIRAEPSGETGLDPNAPPIGAVLHALGDIVLPRPSSTRCPLCGDLPIGHEGECEP